MLKKNTSYARVIEADRKPNPPYVAWETNLGSITFQDWNRADSGLIDSNSLSSKFPTRTYSHDFKLDVPSNAKIESIEVNFSFGKSGSLKIRKPQLSIKYGEIRQDELVVPYERELMGDSAGVNTVTFRNGDGLKITPSMINGDNFGVVFDFDDPNMSGSGRIFWYLVHLSVNYHMPSATIKWGNGLSYKDTLISAPNKIVRTEFGGTIVVQDTARMDFGDLPIKIDLPFGMEVVSISTRGNDTWDSNTSTWTLKWESLRVDYLAEFRFISYTVGTKEIKISNALTGEFIAYCKVVPNPQFPDLKGEHDAVYIYSDDLRRNVEGEIHFKIKGFYDGTVVNYMLPHHYTEPDDTQWLLAKSWRLDPVDTSPEVSIDPSETNGGNVRLKVPNQKEVNIHLIATVKPKWEGADVLWFESDATYKEWKYDYVVNQGYKYVLLLRDADLMADGTWKYKNNDALVFGEKRIASQIETGAYSFPCRTNPLDKILHVLRSSLRMQQYKDINYIGCIPLRYTHYDPKYSNKDTLLNNSTKNVRYMGKKGSPDETLSLNIKLHPHQVSTLTGLIEMDKPVPINTNVLCFEGDVLNHRGWFELYGVDNVTKTNPWVYDCDIQVKNLTKNINTRFQILRGDRISNYFLPNLLVSKAYSGDKFNDYFLSSMTGSYSYHEDIDPVTKKKINLPKNNRYILDLNEWFKVSGLNSIAPKAEFTFRWDSTRVRENKDNDVSRVIRLVDSRTLNPVMEYEYYDFNFNTTKKYPCRVLCRVLSKGVYKTVLNKKINLHSDVEAGINNEDVDTYGSIVNFKLIGDKLSIHDEGLSSKEVFIEGINLENGDYFFEVEFKNNNTHLDAPAIVNYVDFELKEVEYSSKYVNYYERLLVSPFPIPKKTLLFTRECQEGDSVATVFYHLDDGFEATYKLSPFYQYWTGVNLESKDGISLFNLNNSHEVVYMNNGLVKLGINRYNGRLTLYKYDRINKIFVEICRLQATKYNDININHYTDDKLEIQVSDTIFTMWRGRPYIQVNHPTEDLLYSSKVNTIWAEKVNGVESDLSKDYFLVDDTNKLPACVGNPKRLLDECIYAEEVEEERLTAELSISASAEVDMNVPTKIYVNSIPNIDVKIVINNQEVGTVTTNGSGTGNLTHIFNDSGDYNIVGVFLGDIDYVCTISDMVKTTVRNNGYKLKIINKDIMYHMEEDYRAKLTIGDIPVVGESITFKINGVFYRGVLTDSDGVATLNNTLHPGNYTLDVEYYHTQSEVLVEDTLPITVKKGYSNIAVNTQVITRGQTLAVFLTNNLDPEDDDVDDNYIRNVNVEIKVNGVTYHRVTNNLGEAYLDINLLPRTYDVMVTFNGDRNYMESKKNFELKVNE